MVTDVFPRLSNTFVINQITGLLDAGHDVQIFAQAAGDFERAHPQVGGYGLRERMRHLPIPRSRARRALGALGLLSSREAWHPAVRDALDVRRHGWGALSLVDLYTAVSLLREAPFDIIHVQFGKLAPRLLRLVGSGSPGGRLVTSFRGADLTSWLARHPRIYDELFAAGDLFLPVCGAFRDRLVAEGCEPDRVVVHRSGIAVGRFPFQERRRAPGEETRLLFVGRLSEKKGVEFAVRALAHALAAGRRSSLTIIGEGELRGRIERLAADLGLGGHVRLLGGQPQERVSAEMQRAHLLLAPSVTAADGDQEGIPNVLKEAMACGLPVLATRHSGIPELVEDGVSGLLVPERDQDSLDAALLRLVDEVGAWPAMGRAGRAKVEAEYDSAKLNEELERLYRQALARPARTGGRWPGRAGRSVLSRG